MLVVHAADLHLGKTLHDRDLLPDQAHMLDRLLELLASRRPAALLLAGDIYDRSIPPPEALGLFDAFLNRALQTDPELTVILIPGNHDSAARLSFGAGLLERSGLHVRTRAEDCDRPIMLERRDERLAIWALPFLAAGSFGHAQPAGAASPADFAVSEPSPPVLRSQAELFAEGIARIQGGLVPDAANLLLAHCFAAGGAASDSERIFVGAAEQIDPRSFDIFDYAALGHLHRPQSAGKRGRYSGAPLAYSFGESEGERGFLVVELRRGGYEAELVPCLPLHPVKRVEGSFASLTSPGAHPELRESLIEARLTDAAPVLNPADALRLNFPNLLSVRQAAFELSPSRLPVPKTREEGGRGVEEDFAVFHAEMRGEEASIATKRLFAELLEEAQRETP